MSDTRLTVDPIEVSTANDRIRLKIDLAFGAPGFDYEPAAAVGLAVRILQEAGLDAAAAMAASMFLGMPLQFADEPAGGVS